MPEGQQESFWEVWGLPRWVRTSWFLVVSRRQWRPIQHNAEALATQTILVTRITSLLVLVFSWNLSKNKKNIECDQADPLISSDQILFSSKSKDPVWSWVACTLKKKKKKTWLVWVALKRSWGLWCCSHTERWVFRERPINWFLQHFFSLGMAIFWTCTTHSVIVSDCSRALHSLRKKMKGRGNGLRVAEEWGVTGPQMDD